MKRWRSLGFALLLLPMTLGAICGAEKDPEPEPCTQTCATSAQCPLALQYRCSADQSCNQTQEACMAVCCPGQSD